MNRSYQRVYQGVRSDRYSGSKMTNWAEFHPWHSAVEKLYKRHRDGLLPGQRGPLVVVEPTSELFVCPLTSEDILDTLGKVPQKFVDDLRAVFVLAGSTKQGQVVKTLYCFGTYWRKCIFLAPFPKGFMQRVFRRRPKPSILSGYARAGAQIRQTANGLLVEFDRESVRRFYVHDVLMHELAHHVDRNGNRPGRKSEGFAEWFATEYGYRLHREI